MSVKDCILIADHLTYVYGSGTERVVKAVDDVSFTIHPGEMIGLIGHTGSGKSTLIQHLNGLLAPSEGSVYYHGKDIHDNGFDRKTFRSKVGLVFQYPEHQLFEETVHKDVLFGPKNMGLSAKEADLRAYEALKMVGLEDEYFYQSPFDLSGGQKRKVAIAGVLAMRPEVLILDEPTAGLDPKGRDEILGLVKSFKEKQNMSIILVSHSMEDVAEYVDRIMVMDNGKLVYDDTPEKVFAQYKHLEEMGLRAPEMTYITDELRKQVFPSLPVVTTLQEAKEAILGTFLLGSGVSL